MGSNIEEYFQTLNNDVVNEKIIELRELEEKKRLIEESTFNVSCKIAELKTYNIYRFSKQSYYTDLISTKTKLDIILARVQGEILEKKLELYVLCLEDQLGDVFKVYNKTFFQNQITKERNINE